MNAPYAWLEQDWLGLARSLATDTLGHAYLLSGREGLGKAAFATAFAHLVLCEAAAGGRACGQCRGCALTASGNHPDLKRLVPEEERKSIVIDQVRELSDFYALKPHYRARKVTLIAPAEMMTTGAANALLKILEEPPAGALILLVSHRPGQLAATIRSRCQILQLHDPDWDTSIPWLSTQLSASSSHQPGSLTLAGAPLDLLEQLESDAGPPFDALIETLAVTLGRRENVLQRGREHAGQDIRRWIDALELLVRALVLLQWGHQLRVLHVPEPKLRRLQEIANKLNSKRLFLFLDHIADARSMVLRSAGIRGVEVVENLLYRWSGLNHTETQV